MISVSKYKSGKDTHRKRLKIDIDAFQKALATGCLIHPVAYRHFIERLRELERKGKVCLCPSTILNGFVE